MFLSPYPTAKSPASQTTPAKPSSSPSPPRPAPWPCVTVPRLTELADRFKGKVEFLIINSRDDSNAAITDALSASSTTEVFFLDSARTVLYRGAVDDQYGLGYQLDAPRQTFLIDAIDSLLASRPIATPATTAPGCLVECKINPKPSPVTFHNRISRIIQYNCQECHRPGEPAPFESPHLRRRQVPRQDHQAGRRAKDHAPMVRRRRPLGE